MFHCYHRHHCTPLSSMHQPFIFHGCAIGMHVSHMHEYHHLFSNTPSNINLISCVQRNITVCHWIWSSITYTSKSESRWCDFRCCWFYCSRLHAWVAGYCQLLQFLCHLFGSSVIKFHWNDRRSAWHFVVKYNTSIV